VSTAHAPTPESVSSATPKAPRRRRMKKRLGLMLTLAAAEAARPAIGGQAVIEGVMMRSPHSFAVAVRRPDGTIAVREEQWLSFAERFKLLKLPLFRGANMLVESMFNGLGALNFSAEQAMLEEEEDGEEANKASADKAVGPVQSALLAPAQMACGTDGGAGGASKWATWATLGMSMVFAIALFKALPHFSAYGIGMLIGGGENALPVDSAAFHLIDGIIKLSVFVGYILAISRLDDVKRLFMYHGAEHMSVHSWEAHAELDVEHTRERSTAHPRCGTTLILLVISVSIVVFVAVIPFLPRVSDSDLVQTLFALAVKVPLMLPVAGIAYEFQRAAAKRPDNVLVKAFIAPGMLMQRLTTRQPSDPELEVALAALRKTVWREAEAKKDESNKVRGEAKIEVFESFDRVRELVPAAG
jgi:uncharacterized protein YqhQ